MKYYRLIFRSQDRITGTTYDKPKFRIELPSNSWGNNLNKKVRIVLEGFDGYSEKPTDAFDTLDIDLYNMIPENYVETDSVNGFSSSGTLGYAEATSKTANEVFYHYKEQAHSDLGHYGAIMSSGAFNQGQLQFSLHTLNGLGMAEPTTKSQYAFYRITLGVYIDDECSCKK